jgi:hypothetical protein
MADRSRMNREVHVRFCGGLEVKFLRSTRLQSMDNEQAHASGSPVSNGTEQSGHCYSSSAANGSVINLVVSNLGSLLLFAAHRKVWPH